MLLYALSLVSAIKPSVAAAPPAAQAEGAAKGARTESRVKLSPCLLISVMGAILPSLLILFSLRLR